MIEIYGYTNANWASSVSDRRCSSRFMFSLGSGAVSWSSKKHPILAFSNIEAKYRGAVMATCEVPWLRKLLDMG